MVIGIRPLNDYAFKKIFGSPANKLALISLLNAILDSPVPIVDVVILNPFNLQDFEQDKLSILDVKATDQNGVIYDIEIQIAVRPGLVQRLVFYGCDEYAGQLRAGDPYTALQPVVVIALLKEMLWTDTPQLHHRFALTDRESGRELTDTLSIHTLELGKYNLTEAELESAPTLQRWLYWLIHAEKYEPERLFELFPEAAFQLASTQLIAISEESEDKKMYDAREKAIRDHEWAVTVARDEGKVEGKIEGKIEGEIKTIRILQNLLGLPATNETDLAECSLAELQAITTDLQRKFKNRNHSQ
jgi:predicted transposase/invertase (TIGR01784 family)